jgi:hypothetical protein
MNISDFIKLIIEMYIILIPSGDSVTTSEIKPSLFYSVSIITTNQVRFCIHQEQSIVSCNE